MSGLVVDIEIRVIGWPSRAIVCLAPLLGAERASRWAVALAWRLSRWRVVGSRRWERLR